MGEVRVSSRGVSACIDREVNGEAAEQTRSRGLQCSFHSMTLHPHQSTDKIAYQRLPPQANRRCGSISTDRACPLLLSLRSATTPRVNLPPATPARTVMDGWFEQRECFP